MNLRPFLTGLAIALLAAAPAAALGFLSDSREAFSSYQQNTDSATPSPLFSDFSAAVSALGGNGASQKSWLGAWHWGGSGEVFSRDPSEGFAYSHFGIRFQTDDSLRYELLGELENGWVRLQQDPIDDGPVFFSANGAGSSSFAETGLLPAGEYGLTLSAQVFPGNAPASASWHFEFQLGADPGQPGAAMPEPGSALLFAIGAALVGRRARQPRRTRRV